MHIYTDTHIYRYTYIQIHIYTDTHIYRYTDIQGRVEIMRIFQRKIRVNISFGVAEIISHFQLKKGGWEGEGYGK